MPVTSTRSVSKAARCLSSAVSRSSVSSKGLKEFDVETFIGCGLASKGELVKVLGNGELTAAVEVKANAFSKSAVAKIEAAGGKATVIE